MHDAGHAQIACKSLFERYLDGPGAGLHAHTHDHLLGDVLYGARPAHDEAGVRGKKKSAEGGFFSKKIILLLQSKIQEIYGS